MEEQIKILNTAISAVNTIEGMDSLKGMSIYRQSLKQSGNRFLKELEAFTGEVVPLIWGIDNDESFYKLIDFDKQLNEKIITLLPEDKEIIIDFLERLKLDRDGVIKYLESDTPEKV